MGRTLIDLTAAAKCRSEEDSTAIAAGTAEAAAPARPAKEKANAAGTQWTKEAVTAAVKKCIREKK